MSDHSPDTGNMVDRADTLEALALRAEAGEASREMDAELTAILKIPSAIVPDWAVTNFPHWRARSDGRVECVHEDGSGGAHWQPNRITSSLDAVSSLQEVVLPGWHVALVCYGSLGWLCDLACLATGHIARSTAPTEPLARLAAILRALAVEIREGRS